MTVATWYFVLTWEELEGSFIVLGPLAPSQRGFLAVYGGSLIPGICNACW